MNDVSQHPLKISILFVEDEEFLASVVATVLRASGFEVTVQHSVSQAIEVLSNSQPNLVITDLNFGEGPNGLNLIAYIENEFPWIQVIILSAHQSVELATGKSWQNTSNLRHIVKSHTDSLQQILEAIEECFSPQPQVLTNNQEHESDVIYITDKQAKTLHLVGQGDSNASIAKKHETTSRAVELMLTRLYKTLGLSNNDLIDPRIVAVQMLKTGKIRVL